MAELSGVLAYCIAGLSVAAIVMAASWGIGKIGATALDAMARQPEASGEIRGAMILAAALIEGIAFFAAVICLLIVLLK